MRNGGRGRKKSTPGEHRSIPRRDFVQGALVAAASTLAGPLLAAPDTSALEFPGAQDREGYYPPRKTGLRGSHAGSFEGAHALRDGTLPPDPLDTRQSYDLIVVGGGISGLAAAHFFRARHSRDARILILDNHDDFGGHAKRNEFELKGRMHLMNGGTLMIESPRPYSAVASGLIQELGIDVEGMYRRIERPQFYEALGLRDGVFLDRETFGKDHLLVGAGDVPVAKLLASSPLPERVRNDIARVEESSTDWLPGLSSAEKKLRLSQMSYRDFLLNLVKTDPLTTTYYQSFTHGFWGVGIEAVSALDCWAMKAPGFQGMALEPGAIPRMGYSPAGFADTGGSPVLHFPDGNATVARLLVRRLIPAAVPGSNVEDVVTSKVRYDRLDSQAEKVRLRLSSIAVSVKNAGDAANSTGVHVNYVRDGKAYAVHGQRCVLASWNMMIPYLCPDLPPQQKEALHSLVKTPLVYTTVALRNWQSFAKLGISRVECPGSYHTGLGLNPNVDIGKYRSNTSPSDPILVRMERTPCKPGLTEREQNKVGRAELLGTSFATFEHHIRDQLGRVLGPGGFDPEKDIEAITVNRWPHGYAPEYNPLSEPLLPEAQQPHIIGRVRFGRIAIANSDSGRAAYTDSAIDQASRAVNELLAV